MAILPGVTLFLGVYSSFVIYCSIFSSKWTSNGRWTFTQLDTMKNQKRSSKISSPLKPHNQVSPKKQPVSCRLPELITSHHKQRTLSLSLLTQNCWQCPMINPLVFENTCSINSTYLCVWSLGCSNLFEFMKILNGFWWWCFQFIIYWV